MDNKKYKYTLEDFYNDVFEALNEEPAKPEGGTAKPSVMNKLLAQTRLGKGKQ